MANDRFPVRPAMDSVWQCPCGFRGGWQQIGGHRKGWKKRDACRGPGPRGERIWMIDPGSGDPRPDWMPQGMPIPQAHDAPAAPPIDPEPEPLPEEEEEESSVGFDPFVYSGLDDAEALAAALNRERGFEAPSPGGNGHGPVETLELGAEGEWSEEKSASPLAVSEFREAVTLPAVAKVIYDWARAQGWGQGDGSLSAFILDVLLDHFSQCWGMKIVVVSREEVEIGRA